MIDYHVHTSLSNHAEGVMEAYVKRAVELGFVEICFLDHLTIRETIHQAGQGLSMAAGEIPLYFQAVQFLKHQYQEMIKVKAGIELDFNPEYVELFTDIVGTFAFDVVGSSLHFLDDLNIVSSGSAMVLENKNIDSLYERYFEQLEKMLDYDYFDVICHFDLVKKFGRKSCGPFEKELNRILSKIKEKNLTVEINTSGYDHPAKEVYPSPDIINSCYQKGIGITLGSDAHHPGRVGRHYEQALSLLRSAGYRDLTTFTRRTPGKVPIV